MEYPATSHAGAIDPTELADLLFEAADDEKAQDIAVLDVHDLTVLCERFVICHALSLIHLQAIATQVQEKVHERVGVRPHKRVSGRDAKWVLLDYGSVIFHLFTAEARGFYGLEDLWGKATVVRRLEA
jgi:ribosome-associated protein